MGRVLALPVALLTMSLAPGLDAGPAGATRRLFVIERSLNANAVAYDVVTTGTGQLDPGSPLRAYWIMNARCGEVEELTFAERSWAYGYDVRMCDPKRCTVALRALKDRPIVVEIERGEPRAITRIGAEPAVLRSVFVSVRRGGALPVVESLELFGETCVDAAPVSERISRR